MNRTLLLIHRGNNRIAAEVGHKSCNRSLGQRVNCGTHGDRIVIYLKMLTMTHVYGHKIDLHEGIQLIPLIAVENSLGHSRMRMTCRPAYPTLNPSRDQETLVWNLWVATVPMYHHNGHHHTDQSGLHSNDQWTRPARDAAVSCYPSLLHVNIAEATTAEQITDWFHWIPWWLESRTRFKLD